MIIKYNNHNVYMPITLFIFFTNFLKIVYTILKESLMTPEKFAQILCDDLDTPVAHQFVQQIADQIRKQCSNYVAALEGDTDGDEYEKDNDLRIVIKLDINVGTINLKDQFEWPLYSSLSNSMAPEEFAKKLTAELGLGGEFTNAIAHSIREQIYTARLNIDDTNFALNLDRYKVPPFRSKDEDIDEWYPVIREMTEEEIERKHKEQERNIRLLLIKNDYTYLNGYILNNKIYYFFILIFY